MHDPSSYVHSSSLLQLQCERYTKGMQNSPKTAFLRTFVSMLLLCSASSPHCSILIPSRVSKMVVDIQDLHSRFTLIPTASLHTYSMLHFSHCIPLLLKRQVYTLCTAFVWCSGRENGRSAQPSLHRFTAGVCVVDYCVVIQTYTQLCCLYWRQ